MRAAYTALFALVPLAVYYGTDRPSQVKDLLLVVVVTLAALAWLTRLGRERPATGLTALTLVAAINAVLWCPSLLASPQRGEGVALLAVRLAAASLLLLLPAVLRERRDLARAVAVLVTAASLMSLYGLLQFLRIDPLRTTTGLVGHFRVPSTTDHPTVFVAFLVGSLPLTIAALWLFEGRRRRILLAVGLLLQLAAAAATLSRAGYVALGVALLAMLALLRAPDGAPRRLATKVLAGVVIVGIVLGAAVWRGWLDPGERERLLSMGGPSLEKRALVYRAALRMAAAAPLLGHGLAAFAHLLPGYRTPVLARYYPTNDRQLEHAVSEPLEVLVESGVAGLAAWCVLVALFIARPLRARRRIVDPALRAVLCACAAGTAGLVLHGCVEVSLRYSPPLFLFWALPALALVVERVAGLEPRRLSSNRWSSRLALAVLVGVGAGLMLAVTVADFVGSARDHAARRALEEYRPAEAERAARGALAVAPANVGARYRRAYALWQLGRLADAEREYREVARRSPWYFDVNHNLARLLLEQGRVEEAVPWAQRAVDASPYHAPSHELAARILVRLGRLREAEAVADAIMARAGHAPEAHLAVAHVRSAQGRRREARVALEQALRLAPTSKEIRHMLNQPDVRDR